MTRRVLLTIAVLGAVAGLSVPAGAATTPGNATGGGAGGTAAGAGAEIACDFGSCFSPSFVAAGAHSVYRGPAATRIEFDDCCMPGDTYKVVAKDGQGNRAVAVFTSEGSLERSCTTGPYPDPHSIELPSGATVVKMIAMHLPGGTPASAYIRMNRSGWRQTKGGVGCGF